MTEKKKGYNPLRINEEDGLGTVLVKAFAEGALKGVAIYGGVLTVFAGIGYVANMLESKDKRENEEKVVEKEQSYKVSIASEDGGTGEITVNAVNMDQAIEFVEGTLAKGYEVVDIDKV